jgi:hypothetical protein
MGWASIAEAAAFQIVGDSAVQSSSMPVLEQSLPDPARTIARLLCQVAAPVAERGLPRGTDSVGALIAETEMRNLKKGLGRRVVQY